MNNEWNEIRDDLFAFDDERTNQEILRRAEMRINSLRQLKQECMDDAYRINQQAIAKAYRKRVYNE